MGIFLGALRLALGAIARNKTRAVLTVLGILIGVTAVVAVTALADGTSAAVGGAARQLRRQRHLRVAPAGRRASGARTKFAGRLTENDVQRHPARGGQHLGGRSLHRDAGAGGLRRPERA